MRKVPLTMILPDMRLAMSIYHKNQLLLTEGTRNINRYVNSLRKLGITSVYIEDALSKGIEIPDAITEKVRLHCKDVLGETLVSLREKGTFDEIELVETIDQLLEEIMSRTDFLVSLSDIGTTDDSTLVHSVNMTVFSLLIGKKLNYSYSQMRKLAEGCIIHDIGKVLIDPDVLYKPGKLTEREFEYVKQHTVLGYNIAKRNPLLSELSRVVCLSHHERVDGSGYPYGLKGDEIPEFARIAAVADVYDAITSKRCYHDEQSIYDAVDILMMEASSKLDTKLVTLFVRNIAIYPNGSLVQLSDKTYAIVKEQNKEMPMRPVVRVFDPWEQVPIYEVDLMKELDLTIIVPCVTNFK